MSGVDIIGALLIADAAVLAAVPAERIKAGMLPEGADLPALLVRSISRIENQTLKRRGWVRVVERVSVTVSASNYDDLDVVVGLVRAACAGKTGTIADAPNVSVLTAGTGPDLIAPGSIFEKAQDFRVSFDAPV